MTGKELRKLKRSHRVTIRELKARMGVTPMPLHIAVDYAEGVTGNTNNEWYERFLASRQQHDY